MELFQSAQDHVRYGLDVLLYERINRIFEVVVQIVFAVLHYDAELVVFDFIIVDTDYVFMLDEFKVLNFSNEILFVFAASDHFLHRVDLA